MSANNRQQHDLGDADISALLDRRANSIAVHQDLEGLAQRAAGGERDLHAGERLQVGPRRATRTLLAVAAVIAFGLLGVFAVSRMSGGDPALDIAEATTEAVTAASASDETGSVLRSTMIWLDVDTSPAKADELAEWLSQHEAVERYDYIDQEKTYEEFRAYFANEPEILDIVSPGQLPTSFRVFTSDPPAIEEAAARFDFVDDVEPPFDTTPNEPYDGPPGVIIWLDVDVSGRQVAEIAAWLNERPDVISYRYVDTDDTYAEFTEYFADEPEIIDLVEPEHLPTSFDVTTDDPQALTNDVQRFAAVDDVEDKDAQSGLQDPRAQD